MRTVACVLVGVGSAATWAGAAPMGKTRHTREVTFRLTFLNRDVIWLGDPASPMALCYPKPGAEPTATDVCITTRTEWETTRARRHFSETRVAEEDGRLVVQALTSGGEKAIGEVTADGRFVPNAVFRQGADLLPSWPRDAEAVRYDAEAGKLYTEVDVPGLVVSETQEFLPLALVSSRGKRVGGTYRIEYTPADESARTAAHVALVLHGSGRRPVTLAKAAAPRVSHRASVQLGSYDNRSGRYLPESAYRSGGKVPDGAMPAVTFTVKGEPTWMLNTRGEALQFTGSSGAADEERGPAPEIVVDGTFDDWRNVEGISDPRGDLLPSRDYAPNVDLLEFKVANDAERIYFYARVAGRIGQTQSSGARSRLSVYLDVDQSTATGYLPTREEHHAFGVDLGDDCEVQLEFVNDALHVARYGFAGAGREADVLEKVLRLGPSGKGDKGAGQRVAYTLRDGKVRLVEEAKGGSSDTIQIAVSADGSEVEISSRLDGFLRDADGRPTVGLGQSIDLAIGLECDRETPSGRRCWAADSSAVIRGYTLRRKPARAVSSIK